MSLLPSLHREASSALPAPVTDRLRSIADHLPVLIAFVDAEQRFRYNNRTYELWYGVTLDELRGRTMREGLGEEVWCRIAPMVARALKGELVSFQADLTATRAGRWLDARFIPCRDEFGAVAGFHVLGYDITPFKQTESTLLRDRDLAHTTLRAVGDAMITTNGDGRITFLNPAAERLTGWASAVASGLPLAQVFQVVHESTGATVPDPSEALLERGWVSPMPPDALLVTADGTRRAIESSIAPICAPGGSVAGMVIVFRDVTEKRRMAEAVAFHAKHDPLTGLPNRREFEAALDRALEDVRDGTRHHSLLYLDLDQFKVVNDTCGHLAGDQLLCEVVRELTARLRDSDMLARLGGDEFGVLLQGCPLAQGARIAQELVDAVAGLRFEWNGQVFNLGASVGVAAVDSASADTRSALSAADAACYMAKDLGRNRVQVFALEDDEVAQRHGDMHWVSRIGRGFEERRFTLYFQRIVAVRPGLADAGHCEVLLRLRDEHGSLVAPGAFIPAAERYSLMPRVDRWVIQALFAHLGPIYRRGAGPLPCFAVNLSGMSFVDSGFLAFVAGQLEESGVPPSMICFEITETAAVGQLRPITRFMAALRERGCRFALDDFGQGLSSLGYLKSLPVDFLKIDGSFVRNLGEDRVDHALVAAISRVSQVMDVRTIAECVESEGVLRVLGEIGVDYAQGFAIHKPEPLFALERPAEGGPKGS